MAIYMMKQKTFPRGKGACVTQAAAYRAGERLRDERTGRMHSYLGRDDVVYKEVFVPSGFAGNAEIAWTQDRAALWNAVERTDRRNAQLGREVMVVLPEELNAERRTQLVRGFAQELADKYRCAVDTTIHLPRPQSDERNHHAHLLLTPREVTPKGLGPRTSLELSGTERRGIGLGSSKDELLWRRQRWAEVANEALAGAGFCERIDHRALRTIAPDREPELSLPLHIRKIELTTGKPTRVGDELRHQHRERVAARAKGPDELARVVMRQKEEARTAVMRRRALEADLTKRVPRSVLSKAELLQARRERYQAEKERIRAMSPAYESALRWLKWRQRHPEQARASAAYESAQKWLAYREAQRLSEGRQIAARELSRDAGEFGRRRKAIERDKDYGLEL
jgi:MobA/MobL family